MAQHFHKLGLELPSETTSASITAGIVVATHGEHLGVLSPRDLEQTFTGFKARSCALQSLVFFSFPMVAITTHCRGNHRNPTMVAVNTAALAFLRDAFVS